MRPCLVLLLASASLAFAPAPFPKPGSNAKDLNQLQGTWVGPGDLVARFEQNKLSYYRGGKLVCSYRITLNAAAQPKAMDLDGISDARRRYYVIYELQGDTLKTSGGGSQEPRPKAFEGQGKGRDLEILRRANR
jgi:uncharacterized protein (TIGR03067 family)